MSFSLAIQENPTQLFSFMFMREGSNIRLFLLLMLSPKMQFPPALEVSQFNCAIVFFFHNTDGMHFHVGNEVFVFMGEQANIYEGVLLW